MRCSPPFVAGKGSLAASFGLWSWPTCVCPWCISFDHFISIRGSRVSEQDNCTGATRKRPAAAVATAIPAKPLLKRPAAAKPDLWLELAPNGCAKCRWIKGCTPSCWRDRLGREPKRGEHYVIARGFNRRVCSSGVNRQMPLAAVSAAKCVPVPFLAYIR